LHWKTVWLQMIISLILPLHKMVTKANMATHVNGNILEMSIHLTKRFSLIDRSMAVSPYLNLLINGLKGRCFFCFLSALDMKQELNTKALQSALIW